MSRGKAFLWMAVAILFFTCLYLFHENNRLQNIVVDANIDRYRTQAQCNIDLQKLDSDLVEVENLLGECEAVTEFCSSVGTPRDRGHMNGWEAVRNRHELDADDTGNIEISRSP
ncbi:MAG: hypothetical protein ABIA47_00220 [bacterium]